MKAVPAAKRWINVFIIEANLKLHSINLSHGRVRATVAAPMLAIK